MTGGQSNHFCHKAGVLAFWLLLLLLVCGAFVPKKGRTQSFVSQTSQTSSNPSIHESPGNYCPVSSHFNYSKSFLFQYPVDIYDSTHSGNKSNLLKCFSRRVGVYNQHHCPSFDRHTAMKCPVLHDHIYLILKATTWKVQNSHRMIQLLERMFSKEISPVESTSPSVRIIILGGSVTAGHETDGYCCSNLHVGGAQRHLIDRRCNRANDCGQYFEKILPNLHHDDGVTWVKYFSQALVMSSSIPIEIFSLAAPGTTSNYMSSHITGYLNNLPPRQDTTNDIIFIDYSYNDGRVFQGPKRSMLDQAIESLVRNVLTSYPLTPSARPHVILLESYIHSHGVFGRKCNDRDDRGANTSVGGGGDISHPCSIEVTSADTIQRSNTGMDYSTAYRRIAQHYGLQVWSPRNVYWHYHEIHQKNKDNTGNDFPSFLNYMIQGHPPWHTHLYWADAYLSTMKYFLRDHLMALNSLSTAVVDENSDSSSNALVEPLVKAEDISSQQCDYNRPLMADLSFDFNGNINPLSEYATSPLNSWLFVKEGGDKPGWVTQATFPHHTLTIPLNTSNVLKWVTGKTKQERMNRLENRDVVIIFSYLKSYEKMLTVSLEMCNQTIAKENSLWPDRFSLSYTSVLPIGHFIENNCDEFIEQLMSTSNNNPSATHDVHSSLQLSIHSPAKEPNRPSPPQGTDSAGKFKLLGLTICETITGGTPFFSAQTLIP
mmetsp:Transcript_3977/g.6754  ORF Transcript_3977/g.6754 Transcript_3977/m.6754 type:complete len:713 (+) Transcript_3977:61-2199(+)